MAKVVLDDDNVAIQVSWVERLMLAEKSRKVPLETIRNVDPHPPLVDMMVHWADQSAVWLGGVSAYDGHLIPSTRNPNHTLAIEGEGGERIFVEVDDEEPGHLAARIQCAVRRKSGLPPPPDDSIAEEAQRPSQARIELAKMVQEAQARDMAEDEDEDDDVRLRDPLMQGSLPPPPRMPRIAKSEVPPPGETLTPRASGRFKSDRDLARLGGWLVALGSLGVLTGTTIVAAGLVPGLLAVGAGIACGVLGGVALAVVANHRD
jgi:hypothetical protein